MVILNRVASGAPALLAYGRRLAGEGLGRTWAASVGAGWQNRKSPGDGVANVAFDREHPLLGLARPRGKWVGVAVAGGGVAQSRSLCSWSCQ
eukprot:419093-Pyramimonas_sp.AAC.1